MIGKTISHYKILEKLGDGMGRVYKAEDTEIHRFVVLKFRAPDLSRDLGDEYSHGGMTRRYFLDRLGQITGGTAAALVGAWCAIGTEAPSAEPEAARVEMEGQSVAEVRRPRPGEVRLNTRDSERYVWIPPGSFHMGCSPDDRYCQDEVYPQDANEKPRHRVTISKGYWMGQTEVTIGAYRKFAQATQGKAPEELVLAAPERFRSPDFPQGDNYPVVYVTWEEAAQYCQWAGGRLPTEAEWEYAARAGSSAASYGNPAEIAWYGDNSGRSKLNGAELWQPSAPGNDVRYRSLLEDNRNQAQPVGKKAPNEFGLYDMLGNVWEHCADWYGEKYYQVSEERDPKGPLTGECPGGDGRRCRVMRGGDFLAPPVEVRASIRVWMLPDHRFNNIGFRCVCEK
jgi:sulfatase modifying factor 1